MSFAKKTEEFIDKITPDFVKKGALKLVNLLPEKMASWIKNNKFFTICIVYTIRGLFFRPSMWAVYAAIAAYFGFVAN